MVIKELLTMAHWKQVWEMWDIRIIILLSFFLQGFLLFSGPLRKRTTSGYVITPMWLAYLSSSLIATYGLGLIGRRSASSATDGYTHPHLLSLWAPFFLLHLSGQDTFTVYSLEDNELWLRRCLYICVYIYYLISAHTISVFQHVVLEPPTIIFLVGTWKYLAWVDSQALASTVGMGTHIPKTNWLTTIESGEIRDVMTDLQVLQHAYKFFICFKGLAADFSFSFQNCSESRDIFLKLTPRDAFRIAERELIFFYEFLYTKPWMVNTRSSFIILFLNFCLLFAALVLFCKADRYEFKFVDIAITYTLLLGSLFLEASIVFMALNSDWGIAFLRSGNGSSFAKQVAKYLTYATSRLPLNVNHRWSNSISQYDMISFCLYLYMETFRDWHGLGTKMITEMIFVETQKFNENMRDLIIEQLKMKSLMADNPGTAREIKLAKGEWILRVESFNHLLPWIMDFNFDQSLILWHIATELCFNTNDDEINTGGGNDQNLDEAQTKILRDLSKCLSNYMLYLLIMQPKVISTVAILGDKIFSDTCSEVRKFFHEKNIRRRRGAEECRVLKEACQHILSDYNAVQPATASLENSSTSVLIDAHLLAIELKKLETTRMWGILSKVWVEMLCYAASHGKAYGHLTQLKQGGQLITFAWLLMVHFGLVS